MPYTGPPGRDFTFIPNPDPARHYRWIGADQKRLALWTRSFGADTPGYRLERKQYAKPVPASAGHAEIKEEDTTWGLAKKLGLDPEGYVNVAANRIQFQDVVLASIPMEEKERRRAELRQREQIARESLDDAYMARVEGKGVRPFKREMEEHLDRRSYATREGKSDRVFVPGPKSHDDFRRAPEKGKQ